MARGPKSRVPLGIDGLLMDLKNRGQHSALEATTVLNEQGHNQHRGQNPNDLHAGNLQLKVLNQALLSPHAFAQPLMHTSGPPWGGV